MQVYTYTQIPVALSMVRGEQPDSQRLSNAIKCNMSTARRLTLATPVLPTLKQPAAPTTNNVFKYAVAITHLATHAYPPEHAVGRGK